MHYFDHDINILKLPKTSYLIIVLVGFLQVMATTNLLKTDCLICLYCFVNGVITMTVWALQSDIIMCYLVLTWQIDRIVC